MKRIDWLPDAYAYAVPSESIAQAPASPRDSARLLVYERVTQSLTEDTFKNLVDHLPARSVLVLNRTKVVPARVWCTRATGGRVQVLYLRHDAKAWYALLNRPLREGERIEGKGFSLLVEGVQDGVWRLKPSFPLSQTLSTLLRHGTTPIPPYIKQSPLTERQLRREYQTVFAGVYGSVAAPTASLHFTPRLLRALTKAGHTITYVTLHVGLGTFASLTAEQLRAGLLHEEPYRIAAADARAIQKAHTTGRPIVAVGTTVARALESWAASNERQGVTRLFIRAGYQWRIVGGLITNFHVPKSSLMMLVASLVGRERLLALYRFAIARGFRLFSFGDGMLIR